MIDKNKKEIILDGECLLNDWLGLETALNTVYYVSLSNFLYAKVLLGKSIELLKNNTKLMDKYLYDYQRIARILQSSEIDQMLKDFISNSNTYSRVITVDDEQGLYIIIYKGFTLDHDIEDLTAPIEETIAFSQFRKMRNMEIPILARMEELIDFIKELNLDIKVVDTRA